MTGTFLFFCVYNVMGYPVTQTKPATWCQDWTKCLSQTVKPSMLHNQKFYNSRNFSCLNFNVCLLYMHHLLKENSI